MRTPGSWFLASSWKGGGRWVRTALALLVPGYGQCHPFALSNQSSTCGQFFDIHPVIYVMSLGQDLGLRGWETLCCGARFQKSLLPLEHCIVPAWTRKAPPVGISLHQAKEPHLIALSLECGIHLQSFPQKLSPKARLFFIALVLLWTWFLLHVLWFLIGSDLFRDKVYFVEVLIEGQEQF